MISVCRKRRKRPVANLGYNSGVCLEGLRKTKEYTDSEMRFEPSVLRFERSVLATQQRHSLPKTYLRREL